MNVFVLSADPKVAAQYHHDKHVVKMILETAQLLSSVWHVLQPGRTDIYKATHIAHPCAKWARSSDQAYQWLYELGMALCEEYTHRYDRRHKTQDIIELLKLPPANIPDEEGLLNWPCVMPDHYQRPNAIESYRAYYRAEKLVNASWTRRDRPDWV